MFAHGETDDDWNYAVFADTKQELEPVSTGIDCGSIPGWPDFKAMGSERGLSHLRSRAWASGVESLGIALMGPNLHRPERQADRLRITPRWQERPCRWNR